MNGCVFCEIVAGTAPAQVLHESNDSIVIVPLGPVVDGHVLIIPREHVNDAAESALTTAFTMYDAAEWAQRKGTPFNLITSAGREATQSVFHLHVHYVPRAQEDGLMVPWGTAWGENPQDPHRCKRIIELEREIESIHLDGYDAESA